MKTKIVISLLLACCAGRQQLAAQNTFPASGNVGIGTAAPAMPLHVRGPVLAETGAISDGLNRNAGFYPWFDRAYGMELHNLGGKWGLGVFARTDSDIRLGHYGGNETKQNALGVKMVIQNTGQVGIGTLTPLELLHVRGGVMAENSATGDPAVRNKGFYSWTDKAYGMELHNSSGKWGLAVYARTDSDIRLGHYAADETGQGALQTKMTIQNDGKVAVGAVNTAPAGYKLYVEQGLLTEKVKVAIKTSADWADHVFAENYQLMPLETMAQYIRQHRHLPGIPAAKEMVTEGNDLGKTDARLLEKIEELTLHMIDMNRQLQELKKENILLKQSIQNK